MGKWLIKAGIQKTLSLLPYGYRLNAWVQRYVAHTVPMPPKHVDMHLRWAVRHLKHYTEHIGGLPEVALELGTGRQPFVPIVLAVCGVRRVMTVDIVPLTTTKLLLETTNAVRERLEQIPNTIPERVSVLCSNQAPADMLKQLGVEMVIADARQLSLADKIDLIVSNTTLEHIPEDVLLSIFHEFKRIAHPRAAMSHLIDMSDHYGHFDASITPYHFLQHGDFAWRLINNNLLYQNRLRISDYRALHEQTGWHIVEEVARSHRRQQLNRVRLQPRFQRYTFEDLGVENAWIVSSS